MVYCEVLFMEDMQDRTVENKIMRRNKKVASPIFQDSSVDDSVMFREVRIGLSGFQSFKGGILRF